ncbi:MAG: type II secretion system F family protein, partial [Thermoguttaceae bacterium]
MSINQSTNPPSITLDQFIALNDEIGALVKSGVPLEANLAAIGKDFPGRMGKIAERLAQRAAEGVPLPQLITECSGKFPPVYQAIIEAGLRAGRLSAALETLAGGVRRLAESRRIVLISTIYPLMVIMLGWLSFAFFTAVLAPPLAVAFSELQAPGRGFFAFLAWLGQGAVYWGLAGPILLAILFAVVWLQTARASWINFNGTSRFALRLPWFGPMIAYSRNAAFAELLAILVENAVPMPEALKLAAESSGDSRLIDAALHWAEMLKAGEPLDEADSRVQIFPPLLRWLLPAATRQNILLPALKHAAEMYQRRAEHQADLLRMFTP